MNRKLTGMADYSKFPSKLWWLMRGMDLLHTGAIEDSKKKCLSCGVLDDLKEDYL